MPFAADMYTGRGRGTAHTMVVANVRWTCLAKMGFQVESTRGPYNNKVQPHQCWGTGVSKASHSHGSPEFISMGSKKLINLARYDKIPCRCIKRCRCICKIIILCNHVNRHERQLEWLDWPDRDQISAHREKNMTKRISYEKRTSLNVPKSAYLRFTYFSIVFRLSKHQFYRTIDAENKLHVNNP